MTETVIKYGIALNSGDKIHLGAFWIGVFIIIAAHVYILATGQHFSASETIHSTCMLMGIGLILYVPITTKRTNSPQSEN